MTESGKPVPGEVIHASDIYSKDEVNDLIADKTRSNLLKPILKTTTLNSITATSNGDGTYILNGKAVGDTRFYIREIESNRYKNKKLVGCPSGGSTNSYCFMIDYFNSDNEYQTSAFDSGNGATIADHPKIALYLFIKNNATLNNIVFKPMITDDLSATYDDYVSSDDIKISDVLDYDEIETDVDNTKGKVAGAGSIRELKISKTFLTKNFTAASEDQSRVVFYNIPVQFRIPALLIGNANGTPFLAVCTLFCDEATSTDAVIQHITDHSAITISTTKNQGGTANVTINNVPNWGYYTLSVYYYS